MAYDMVIAGAYKGKIITCSFGGDVYIQMGSILGFGEKVFLNMETVSKVELNDTEETKSASSAILRGGAGAVLLGPIGLAAALSAKNKKRHSITIYFKDGKQSIADVGNNMLTLIHRATFRETIETPGERPATEPVILSNVEQLERLALMRNSQQKKQRF